MRVLFFVDVPHRLAGAQRSLLAALEQIGKHGIEPLVLFPSPGICVDTYRAAGIRTMILPAPQVLLVFGKRLLEIGAASRARILVADVVPYARRIAEIVERESIDALHFNTPRGILAAGWAARFTQRPSVLHLRGQVPFGGVVWAMAQALADRIILVAKALESAVHPAFVARARVVYNGVRPPPSLDRAAARRRLSERVGFTLDEREMVFLSLSSVVPFKGLHHLLSAAALARSTGLQARFVLAGDGNDEPYERWLRTRCRELGLESIVHFLGFVRDPLSMLPGADALVLTSVSRERLLLGRKLIEVWGCEGLPRSILEAMAAGLPVVSSDTGGAVEQVEQGETGWIVPPGDPEALASKLLAVGSDPAWRAAAGLRAREIVASRFTIGAAAAGLANVLQEVAGAAVAPRKVA